MWSSECVQHLVLKTAEPEKVERSRQPPFARFWMRCPSVISYVNIVVYKTAFYTFYLPIACAMLLAGVTDEVHYKKAREICILMGTYFQARALP